MSIPARTAGAYQAGEPIVTGQENAPAGSPLGGINMARLAKIPLRRWQLSLVRLPFSGAVAFLGGQLFSNKSWKSEGTLEYSTPEVPDVLKGIYSAHSRETLMDLANSPDIAAELCKEFNLAIPPEIFFRLFEKV